MGGGLRKKERAHIISWGGEEGGRFNRLQRSLQKLKLGPVGGNLIPEDHACLIGGGD